MYGWMGTILRVDLTSRTSAVRELLTEELGHKFIGGRGINGKILYDEVKPHLDPLSPENRLIFGSGLLSGTMLASGRVTLTAMSPMNDNFGDSNAGSHFGPELKYTGNDHVVFTGRADRPVYVWIDNDKVEFRDAQHLWGKRPSETRELIQRELGDPRVQVACIGQAGENMVNVSIVILGHGGICGKSGLGAVMGSKNLKAVAVRGTKGVKIARPDEFRNLTMDLRNRAMQNPGYANMSKYGSPGWFKSKHESGTQNFRNSQEVGYWPGYEGLSPDTLYNNYIIKKKACFGCISHCRSWYEVKEGPFAGLKGVGMELAHQQGLGAFLDINSAGAVYKMVELCDEYGIDSSETGQLIGAAMEWYQDGLITKQDLQGLDLTWGNYDAAIKLIEQISLKKGFGALLGEGGVKAARKLRKGAEKYITWSKGVLHQTGDMRESAGYMLGEAVSTRGADHLRGSTWFGAIPGSYEGVAKSVYENQLMATITNCLEICTWNTTISGLEINLEDVASLISAVTGRDVDVVDVRDIADRVWNLERAFQVREGISRKDDVLKGRLWDEPMHGGPLDGLKVDKVKWQKMLDEYYEYNGWDKKTGIPTRARLESLGLGYIADELEQMEKTVAKK